MQSSIKRSYQVLFAILIVVMAQGCAFYGERIFFEEPVFAKQDWALEYQYRQAFFKRKNIAPQSLQGPKKNVEVQKRWQEAEDAWAVSPEHEEFLKINEKNKEENEQKRQCCDQRTINLLWYYEVFIWVMLVGAGIIAAPLLVSSYLLNVFIFVLIQYVFIRFRGVPQQNNRIVVQLLIEFLLLLLVTIYQMRKKQIS